MAVMAMPPPLPGRVVPPPLPARVQPPMRPMPGGYRERPGEFDQRADRQMGRDSSNLPTGQMFGVWIAVNSTWANKLWFKPDEDDRVTYSNIGRVSIQSSRKSTGTMRIEFVSGAICRYDNYPANNFLDLATSSSKGRYIAYELKAKKVPYTLERSATKTAAQVRAIVKARQPVTASQKARFYNVGGRHRAGGGTPSRR